ncbi:Conserved TM helix [Dethiosulfatibacter aminovorans DSM 17477]|uniref:Conserved TM helix n=1 Tax=Dethiosulfatibacter aminovorans DSM 17477 TaxID=1121476 RepID=A0A1M6AQK7_9FIRM|nr:mechanosensitive ion channel [Dethiosulfatibacter aminovorans]SHI38752.1 Conserved TM helix [Dethiosulfatibacter aminovorans DSM 17477]
MDVSWIQIQTIGGKLIAAVLILVIGWIIARFISSGIKKVLTKSKFINEKVFDKFEKMKDMDLPHLISRGVYYVILIFVLVATLQVLGLTIVTQPLNNILNTIFAYLPQIIGALILVLIAWVIATFLKKLILGIFSKSNIDKKLEEQMEEGPKKVKLSTTIAELVYWLVFLLFLPAILGTLELEGVLSPVQNMVDTFLSFIPNIFAAAVVVIIGWFIAKFVKTIVTNLLKTLNVDRLGVKRDEEKDETKTSLAELLGSIVYFVILIPIIISGLNILGLESIAMPATSMLQRIFNFIPSLLSAFIIVAFAYFIARIVGELITGILEKVGFNKVPELIGLKNTRFNLSELAGKLVMVAIVLFSALEAADVLGFSKVSGLVEQFVLLAGNIIIGLIIIGLGFYVANLIAGIIEKSESKNSKVLSLIAKVAILMLAISMGLSQMGLASNIIEYAFIFLIGALAVAFAIAFGIGGRDLAAKKLDEIEKNIKK